ncbi:hypothetical protein [Pseudoduganella flava]|uniref:Mechanosensitive ion channel family protein n=1 Tax=Pseudoduganella flava TaxID=871742 RepID=A0ABX6FQF2_9BURK|nr:hypothetical protein [Pseudoduganella flava]QGZ37622.1 hypothetical protein GO485_00180 [Pseudoduganella flava]
MPYLVLHNDLATWAIAICIGLVVYASVGIARRVVVKRLRAFAQTTATYLDDLAARVLDATHPLFMLLIGAYVGSHWLSLPESGTVLLSRLAIAALLLQAARWGDVGVQGWLHQYRAQRSALDAASTTTTAALGFVETVYISSTRPITGCTWTSSRPSMSRCSSASNRKGSRLHTRPRPYTLRTQATVPG